MAYINGIPLRDSIHTDFSTGSGVWQEYRRVLTGTLVSGGGTNLLVSADPHRSMGTHWFILNSSRRWV